MKHSDLFSVTPRVRSEYDFANPAMKSNMHIVIQARSEPDWKAEQSLGIPSKIENLQDFY